MEVIGYEEPDSWESKGMDWNVPDPRRADYAMAIRNALMERFAAVHAALPGEVLGISPWKTVSVDQMAACVAAIETVAGKYVNRGWTQYADDWSDFPKMWTYRDLVQADGCRLYAFAKPGDLCENGGEWLKAMKNALDRLTLVRCQGLGGRKYSRFGTRHDPPFDESIGDAFEQAFGSGCSETELKEIPTEVYAWSGNTHWKCPDPDEEESESNCNGYCGYAESLAYRFTRIRNWAVGREFDFLAYTLVTEPTGPVPYSVELATSVFDAGESGFRKGMNPVKVHVKDALGVDIEFGNVDSIPRNGTVPSSDFDSEGHATHRRSAKRGYVGKMWFLQDYACENGFRFRNEEEQ